MRNFTLLLLLAAFFLASFSGATSPDTIQGSRLFSSANAIERGTKRVLRVARTGLFNAKTSTATYVDTQTLSGIDELMVTFKGLKRKSGDDLSAAIAAIAAKTNVDVAGVENAYKAYKLLGASKTKKVLTVKMESSAWSKIIDNIADTLVARFEGKSWPEVRATLKVSGADP